MKSARHTFPLELIQLDRRSAIPLHRQLYQSLKTVIAKRTLEGGVSLPSTRALAAGLGLARNTVTTAYDQLAAEGYLSSRLGARPVIVDLPATKPSIPKVEPQQPMQSLSDRGSLMVQQTLHYGVAGRMALHPGVPDSNHFPFRTWSRLLSRRAGQNGPHFFGNHDAAGYPGLRHAIAAYLNAARGLRCAPDQIVVTTGAQAAIDLLARLLLDPGDTVWMEEPGYYGAQGAFAAAGGRQIPLHVDAGGWMLEPPAGPRIRAIYVTPSCQHPLNAAMRMEQRLRLLAIAERHKAWVIEDDFDGEYRFRGQPVPTLQEADRGGRVIYVGTFAKLMFPALRVGFMVLPPGLVPGISRAISVTGQFAPLLLQAAIADFIDQGHMARHIRRMRRFYGQRRQLFSALWKAKLAGSGTLSDASLGIQVVAHLGPDVDDAVVADLCRHQGVSLLPLSGFYRHGPGRSGLVIGYGAADEPTMQRGLDILSGALESAAGPGARRLA